MNAVAEKTVAVDLLTDVTLPEKIKTETDVNNVARQLILLNREVAKVDEEAAVIEAKKVIADAKARQQELGARATELAETYHPQIEKFAAKKCESSGVRTWETALMEVKFTWCPDIVLDVLGAGKNTELAIDFIKSKCPAGIVMKPSIAKQKFTDEFKKLCANMKTAELAKVGMKVVSLPHDSVKFTLKHEDILKEAAA